MVSWLSIRRLRKRPGSFWRALLAMLPVLTITGYLFFESRKSERLLLEAETAHQADNAFLQFQSFVAAHVSVLKDVGSFVLAAPDHTAGSPFNSFVTRLFSGGTEFDNIVWKTPDDGRSQTVRAPGSPGTVNSPPVPLLTDAQEKARNTRLPVATPSYRLGPQAEATTVVVPLLADDRLLGYVEGTIRLTAGARQLFGRDVLDFWNVEVFDRTGRRAFQAMSDGPDSRHVSPALVAERHVPVVDRAWKLRLWATPLLIADLHTGASWRILGIGTVAALLLAFANVLLAQREARLAESLRESKRLAADVAASQQHLSEVVNGIEAAIWESDAQMTRFTFVNEYARKLLGILPADWVSEPAFWYQHVHPEDRELAMQNALSAQTPGWTYPVEYRMVDAHGATLWVQELVTVIGEGEDVTGRRNVVVDITARIQAEEALRQSQKLESIGVLAGGIAHDFNNLLTTILGNAEMLAPYVDVTPFNGRVYLDKIERTTRRLAELTRQMLAYSGRGQFTVGRIDLNAAVREMADLLTVSTPKNVQIAYRLAPDLPAIEGGSAQIRQVILNLMTNAVEAIGEKPGNVVLQTGAVDIDATEASETFAEQGVAPGRYVRLVVSDDGCGMNEETLSKIFDPFFTTKFTGRGLGLAALRGIVRGHHGGIHLFSQPGEGTVFTLVFPALDKRAALVPPPTVPVSVRPIGQARVLVVDDEEGLRSLMVSALAEAGCTVYEAGDGEEGLARFEEHADEIDVVVLDLTMPKLGGDEVFRRIRAGHPGMRVILCSGYTEEDIIRHFDGQGLSGFIEKPFRPSELIKKIGEVLAESPRPGDRQLVSAVAPKVNIHHNIPRKGLADGA